MNETRKPTCNALQLALERLEEFGKWTITYKSTSPCTTGKDDDFAVHVWNAAVREVQTWCPPGAISLEEGTRAQSAVRHQRLCLIQLPQKVSEERVRWRVSLRCGEPRCTGGMADEVLSC